MLGQGDERSKVENDLAVARADSTVALAGEHLNHRLMRDGIDLDPGCGHGRAGYNRVHGAVYETSYRAGDLRAELAEQRADLGQPSAVELGGGLIDGPGYVDPAGYLVRDLIGQDILDRWVVDQRFHGRHIPAGVGNLVGSPDTQHRHRSEYAADHDEQRGDRGPPADPPTPPGPRLLLLEFGGLG